MKQFTAFEYLCIDTANHFGLDKELFETRINWVKENWAVLEFLTDKADEPLLYRKAVMALRKAVRGEAVGHMVALDACCSGIQIMSALMGCKKGAHSTGLIDPEARMDAYKLTEDRMNHYLKRYEMDAIHVDRKDVKRAVMTSCYGSKKEPRTVFGEGELLNIFYKATSDVAEGAFSLLDDLLATWKPNALSHSWTLPDTVHVNVKVMQKVEKRLEVDELGGYQMTAQYQINAGTERGVSNVANVVHSLDAYLLRTLVRRCNYNPKQMSQVTAIIEKELEIRYPNYPLTTPMTDKLKAHYDAYVRTQMLDTAIISYINQETAEMLPSDYLEKLLDLLKTIQSHRPFEVATVHDAFMCLPANCNRMRYWYKEILAEFAESTILDSIMSELMGVQGSMKKFSKDLGTLIRQSNYAIC